MSIGSTVALAGGGVVLGAGVTGALSHYIASHDKGGSSWMLPTLGNTQLGLFTAVMGFVAKAGGAPAWTHMALPIGAGFAAGSFFGGITGAELAQGAE